VRLGGAPQTYLRATNSPLITRQFDHKAFEDEELVVLGARLFPHRISKGYGNATFAVVTHVGEVPIRNLRHLVETLRDAKDEFIVLKIAGKYETLVFRRRELIDSTEEILDNEGIRRQYSDDLREVWKK